jgi:hypothetical protein
MGKAEQKKFIALFFSYFRTRHCLQVITEVGHLVIRRTRQGEIVSGGHDTWLSRQGPACRQHLSHPPDASGPKSATSASCACCRTRRLRQVGLRAPKPVGTPRADASSPILLLQLFFLLSLLFLSCSSNPPFSNLISSILRAFLDQNQWNLLQEVEDSPIYKWVSFRRNFVGSFCHI